MAVTEMEHRHAWERITFPRGHEPITWYCDGCGETVAFPQGANPNFPHAEPLTPAEVLIASFCPIITEHGSRFLRSAWQHLVEQYEEAMKEDK